MSKISPAYIRIPAKLGIAVILWKKEEQRNKRCFCGFGKSKQCSLFQRSAGGFNVCFSRYNPPKNETKKSVSAEKSGLTLSLLD